MDARSRKRKRTASTPLGPRPEIPPNVPPESINPLSYRPGTLRQFGVAGLSELDAAPSTWIPGFPHRPAQVFEPSDAESEPSASDGGSEQSLPEPRSAVTSKANPKPQARPRPATQRGPDFPRELQRRELRDAVYAFLERGEIAKAKRAFGLLLHIPTTVFRSREVDLRFDNYWGLGAEILMREGEEAASESSSGPRRLGLASNMPSVKKYFQTLILRHPYSASRPSALSALHFYSSLWGYEIYNIHVEQKLALQQLPTEAADWDDMDVAEEQGYQYEDELDYLEQQGGDSPGPRGRQAHLNERREQIRRHALESLLEVISRMDNIMTDAPFSRSDDLLRLRGMASLYLGDLLIPLQYEFRSEMGEAQKLRREEQSRARKFFKKIQKDPSDEYLTARGLAENSSSDIDEDESSNERSSSDGEHMPPRNAFASHESHLRLSEESHRQKARPTEQQQQQRDGRRAVGEGPLRRLFSSLNMFSDRSE